MKKNNHFDYGKFCIENQKIKKPRTSDQGKIINSWSDVFENANFVPIFHILKIYRPQNVYLRKGDSPTFDRLIALKRILISI